MVLKLACQTRVFAVIAVLLYMVLFAGCTFADNPPVKLPLTDAVAAALRTNADLKQAEENRLSSQSRLRTGGLTTSYDISTRTSLERVSGDSSVSGLALGNLSYENPVGTKVSLDVAPLGFGNNRGGLDLTLQHPLIGGRGVLSAKGDLVAAMRIEAAIREKELSIARQATVLKVINAYYHAVLARERIKVQERAVSIAEEAMTGARKRAEAGLIEEVQVSRAQIRVAETRDQLNRQQQAARAALDELMIAVGAGVGANCELIDPLPDAEGQTPGLEDAIKTALSNRAELARYDQELSNQSREVAIAEDQLRPRIELVAGYSSIESDRGLISGSLFDAGLFRTGVELHFPIDKRAGVERRDTARRGIDVLRNLRGLQAEEITQQVRDAYRQVEQSKTSLDILGRSVKVAEQSLHLAERMVEEGVDDNRNVLEAQSALTQAESGLLAAKTELFLSSIDLKYAMGENLMVMGSK